jgi:CheY-like chemotaxis protein
MKIPEPFALSDTQLCLKKVYCFSDEPAQLEEICNQMAIPFQCTSNLDHLQRLLRASTQKPNLLLFDLNQKAEATFRQLRYFMLKDEVLEKIPFVVLSAYPSLRWRKLCYKFKVKDYLLLPLANDHLYRRLQQLIESPVLQEPLPTIKWRLPWWKRTMDVLGTSLLLLALSPIIALIILLIKLESKGPAFYISQRAGQSYRVFNFIKFRSMRVNSDQLVENLQDLNQYTQENSNVLPPDVLRTVGIDEPTTVLIQDDAYLIEEEEEKKKRTRSPSFSK